MVLVSVRLDGQDPHAHNNIVQIIAVILQESALMALVDGRVYEDVKLTYASYSVPGVYGMDCSSGI